MTTGYMYIPLVMAGAACVVWGLPAAHRLKRPYDIAAALLVLCGVIAFVLGTLLVLIPGFFR